MLKQIDCAYHALFNKPKCEVYNPECTACRALVLEKELIDDKFSVKAFINNSTFIAYDRNGVKTTVSV